MLETSTDVGNVKPDACLAHRLLWTLIMPPVIDAAEAEEFCRADIPMRCWFRSCCNPIGWGPSGRLFIVSGNGDAQAAERNFIPALNY